VAQATLTPDTVSTSPPSPSTDSGGSAQRIGPTLWLFGLTAMTLVFASLLLLGLLTRSAIVDSMVRDAVNAYTVLTATVGLIAMTYVLAMARKAGFFGTSRTDTHVAPAAADAAGLMVAPTVSPHLRQQAAMAHESRTRQARAISAAAAHQVQRRTQRVFMPLAGVASVPGPSVQSARPAPRPVVAVARPVAAVARPVMPIRARSPRPAGGAPAFLRMAQPPMHTRAQPAAWQVRAASGRAPRRVRPQPPSLADRFFGRVTPPPFMPVPSLPHVASPAYRAPQAVGYR
jgi:hypothetical protein